MDSDKYLMIQNQLILFASLIENMELEEFLQAINRADTIGPIMDPTLWMKGKDNMHKIERIAQAARAFQIECKAVGEEFIANFRKEVEQLGEKADERA